MAKLAAGSGVLALPVLLVSGTAMSLKAAR